MKKNLINLMVFALITILLSSCTSRSSDKAETAEEAKEWALVIHGGAGVITRDLMTSERDSAYRSVLRAALEKGESILAQGGTAIDAVEQTIHIMENSPLFNAGRGAVFTSEGTNEMDAAIMNGSDLNAGSVAGIKGIKNPISAARAVMEESVHVMLSGKGALEFAVAQGLEEVEPSYFYTDKRYKQLTEAVNNEKNGTVGCCALDKDGNLAAATSTGGMTNKKYNRIGDAPVIGAGTYANNATCAVSATGHGEYFIRWTVAHDISALMEYRDLSLEEAAGLVINDKLVKAGGNGGVIAVDNMGNVSMPFNSEGMFRGYSDSEGHRGVFIYEDE
ncbi:MAG TPA: isoaspartyl peptidase/L-asparaginase [Bacteroidales bacterium]|nr:isoaspartyl peptidase/L-asparaginase [Bacteroidales bacterium]